METFLRLVLSQFSCQSYWICSFQQTSQVLYNIKEGISSYRKLFHFFGQLEPGLGVSVLKSKSVQRHIYKNSHGRRQHCYFRDEAVKVMKKLLCFKKWIDLYQSCRTFLLRIARNNHNFVNFNYNGR